VIRTSILVLALAAGVGVQGVEAQHRLGGGIHYLRTVDNISDDDSVDLNRNSVSLVVSSLWDFGLIAVDGQVEYMFDYVGTGDPLWQPQVWGLLGDLIYGGLGVGIGYTDGEWLDDPFYAIRAGVDLPLGGAGLDLYGTYRFQGAPEFEDLTGDNLNSVTFAALIRFVM
jgi:hypothetical protein